jgi:hypothetical protein
MNQPRVICFAKRCRVQSWVLGDISKRASPGAKIRKVESRMSITEVVRIEAEDGEAAGTAGNRQSGSPRGRSGVTRSIAGQ